MCPQRLRASPTLRTRISITTRQKEQDGAITFLVELDMVVWRRFAVADFREVGRSLARQAPPVSDIQQHLSAAVLTHIQNSDKMTRDRTGSNICSRSIRELCATSVDMLASCASKQPNCERSLYICHPTKALQVVPPRATSTSCPVSSKATSLISSFIIRTYRRGLPHDLAQRVHNNERPAVTPFSLHELDQPHNSAEDMHELRHWQVQDFAWNCRLRERPACNNCLQSRQSQLLRFAPQVVMPDYAGHDFFGGRHALQCHQP